MGFKFLEFSSWMVCDELGLNVASILWVCRVWGMYAGEVIDRFLPSGS